MTAKSTDTLDAQGTRAFAAQMTWDDRGLPILMQYFEALGANPSRCFRKETQLRGVDLLASTAPRQLKLRTTIDAKVDAQAGEPREDRAPSQNLTGELLSQDRKNTVTPGAALGWPFKEMSFTAYVFAHTAEVLLLDMRVFRPWWAARMAALGAGDLKAFSGMGRHFLSVTPNPTYLSYNVVMNAPDFLAQAPGVSYFRLTDHVPREAYERQMAVALQPPIITDVPEDKDARGTRIYQFLAGREGYAKPDSLPTPEAQEQLLRRLETVVRPPRNDKTRQSVERLWACRPSLVLPGDPVRVA